jgi:uncharacterized membrane protein YidH (DUF202 family)
VLGVSALISFDAAASAVRLAADLHELALGGLVMRGLTIVAILLIVAGVLVLAYGGFSYTRDKKVIDLGPIEATARTRETVPIPPLVGGAAIAGGIVLLVVGSRRRV